MLRPGPLVPVPQTSSHILTTSPITSGPHTAEKPLCHWLIWVNNWVYSRWRSREKENMRLVWTLDTEPSFPDIFSDQLHLMRPFDQEEKIGVRKSDAKTTLKRQELKNIRWEAELHQEKTKVRKGGALWEASPTHFSDSGLVDGVSGKRTNVCSCLALTPVPIPNAVHIVVWRWLWIFTALFAQLCWVNIYLMKWKENILNEFLYTTFS